MVLSKDIFNGFQKLCTAFVKFCANITKGVVKDIQEKQKEADEMKQAYKEAFKEERKKYLIEEARKKARNIEKRHQTSMGFTPPSLTLPEPAFFDDNRRNKHGNRKKS